MGIIKVVHFQRFLPKTSQDYIKHVFSKSFVPLNFQRSGHFKVKQKVIQTGLSSNKNPREGGGLLSSV